MIPSSRGLSRVLKPGAGDCGVRPGGAPPSAAEATPSYRRRGRAGSQADGRHWLIIRGPRHDEESYEVVFTVGERPAIFSFREEAEAFLAYRGSGDLHDDWRVEEFWTEELFSMLHGPLSGFGRLVLDPLPEVADRTVDSLVSIGREEFADLLVLRSRSRTLQSIED